MKTRIILGAFALIMICSAAYAGDLAKGNIRLFQSFFEDAHVTADIYLDTAFKYEHFDFLGFDFDLYNLTLRAGLPISRDTEIHGALGFVYASPDNGSSEKGVSDFYFGGRHLVYNQVTKVSVGGFVTIPTGREKTGQDNFDTGIYSALRHPLDEKIVLTGTVGLVYTETPYMTRMDDDHEAILRLGGGAIYQQSDQLNFIGEIVYKTRYDYMVITGGLDYAFDRKSSIRCALGFGLDNGAPDLQFQLSGFIMF